VLFASFLGFNPAHELLGHHVLTQLSHHGAAVVTGRAFFPHLISGPFRTGLHEAFAFAIAACLLAALASWWRGSRYVEGEVPDVAEPDETESPRPEPVVG
jgi:hypothetical protein